MFAMGLVPFADVRPFISQSTGRLYSPEWPIPLPDVQFIRGAGSVRLRTIVDTSWSGEGHYCDIRNMLKFPAGLGEVGASFGSECVTSEFRRYFSDGICSRIEVAISDKLNSKYQLSVRRGHSGKRLVEIANCLLSVPVSVPTGGNGRATTQLVRADRALADCVLAATTSTKFDAASVDSTWITPGRPLVLIETPSVRAEHPSGATSADFLLTSGIRLSSARISNRGRHCTAWFVGISEKADKNVVRNLRINLCRLHSEREVLRVVLRLTARGYFSIVRGTDESEELQRYLDRAYRVFFSKERFGIRQSPLIAAAYQYDDLISQPERNALNDRLEGVRGNVRRKLTAVLEEANATPIRNLYYFAKGASMTKNRIRVGDVGGDISGSFNIQSSISDSFKTVQQLDDGDDLKEMLEQLTVSVSTLIESLSSEDAEALARDLRSFTDEATSNSPRKSFLQALGDGIGKVAETVGNIGPQVVTLVNSVIGMF